MKITTWNVRGLNAPNWKRLLKQNLKSFNSDIVFIQEIKLNKLEEIQLDEMLGLRNFVFQELVGASGCLGLFWNHRKVSIDVLNINNNWTLVIIELVAVSIKLDFQFILINVHGPISNLGKKVV